MLRHRILTSIVLVPFLIVTIWFGEPWFGLLIAAAAGIAGWEFYRMASGSKLHPLTYFGIACIFIFIGIQYCPYATALPILISSAIVISLIWFLFRLPRDEAFTSWSWTLAGIFYIGWLLSYWIRLRGLEIGREIVFLAMFTTLVSDTGAFFVGRTWGRHQMAPSISSGKTWEGAVGGLICSIAVSFLIAAIFKLPYSYWQIALVGFIISVFAQLGDLVESLLKRNRGVKDAGKVVPGHGGMLDRIDSLLFTGVIVYYLVELAKL
jgi:phosphatidate cytidylyltransferase